MKYLLKIRLDPLPFGLRDGLVTVVVKRMQGKVSLLQKSFRALSELSQLDIDSLRSFALFGFPLVYSESGATMRSIAIHRYRLF